MKLTKVLHFLALGGVFLSGMPMTFLPISISQICIILLFALTSYVTKFRISKILLAVLLYFVVISIVQYKYLEIANIIEFIRLFIYMTAYYMYLSIIGLKSIDYVIKKYFYLCTIFSIIGFIQIVGYASNLSFLYNFSYLDGHERNFDAVYGIFKINSLTLEPAHFALLLLPCIFFIVKGIFVPGTYATYNITKTRVVIIVLAYCLTFSFVAYTSIILIFAYQYFAAFKISFKNIILLGLVVLFAFLFLFYLDTNISKKRESLFADASELQSIENLSAFALISNAQVAWSAANDNPIGTGFFTHKNNYDRYIDEFYVISEDSIVLNKLDGSSMYVKVLSEYSFVGLFLMFCLYWYITYRGTVDHIKSINRMSIIVLLVGFIRLANYTSPVFCLLFALAMYTHKDQINNKYTHELQ
ncbi:hypothetical protein ACX0HA_03415 [Flavobacterium hauense]